MKRTLAAASLALLLAVGLLVGKGATNVGAFTGCGQLSFHWTVGSGSHTVWSTYYQEWTFVGFYINRYDDRGVCVEYQSVVYTGDGTPIDLGKAANIRVWLSNGYYADSQPWGCHEYDTASLCSSRLDVQGVPTGMDNFQTHAASGWFGTGPQDVGWYLNGT